MFRRANGFQASAASVANIYYNHPILNILAEYFDVTYEEASIIPTVMQAGYATGLVFLCPLGDIFRRRAFVLILTSFTATLVRLHLVVFYSIVAKELSAVAWPLLDQELQSIRSNIFLDGSHNRHTSTHTSARRRPRTTRETCSGPFICSLW